MAKKKATDEQLQEAADLGLVVNVGMLETTVLSKIEDRKAELATSEETNEDQSPAEVEEDAATVALAAAEEAEQAETERLEQEANEKAERLKAEEEGAMAEAKDKITWDKVKQVLTQQDSSFESKMTVLKTNGITAVKSLVSKLESYQIAMSPKSPVVNPVQGAAKNFDLLSTIKSAAGETDYQVFKAKFDIINAFFREYSEDAYSEWLLHRYDLEWSWGKESLTAYQFLATAISLLCFKASREEQLSKINLDRALDKELTNLSETAVENIKKYYQA